MSTSKLILQSENLSFSTWADDQLPDLVKLHGDIEVTRHLSGRVETEEDGKRRMAEWQKDFAEHGWCKFRVTETATGAFVGRAGFGVHEGTPEIGYALLPEHQGKGYAVEAASRLRDWFFETQSDDFFIGYAYTENTASTHILRKIGLEFTHTDIDDSGKEVILHKLTREQWRG